MQAPIAVTLGDPAGIGPEVCRVALADADRDARFRLYGPALLVNEIAQVHPACEPVATSEGLDGIITGQYTQASGAASVKSLLAAAQELADGRVAGLVTGPISKRALWEAGLPYPGQTELLAAMTGARRFAMMLAGPRLRVVLATTHLPLGDVQKALDQDKVFEAGRLCAEFLRNFLAIQKPRLGVLGLNPHASDGGRFGDEEARVIAPAVARLVAAGIDATGPIPADTAFYRAACGAFDALVAMYHDQGLGPLKLIHFADAVNITLGLPRPRFAPDHGPAFDIAGKHLADPSSMREAVALAVRATISAREIIDNRTEIR